MIGVSVYESLIEGSPNSLHTLRADDLRPVTLRALCIITVDVGIRQTPDAEYPQVMFGQCRAGAKQDAAVEAPGIGRQYHTGH